MTSGETPFTLRKTKVCLIWNKSLWVRCPSLKWENQLAGGSRAFFFWALFKVNLKEASRFIILLLENVSELDPRLDSHKSNNQLFLYRSGYKPLLKPSVLFSNERNFLFTSVTHSLVLSDVKRPPLSQYLYLIEYFMDFMVFIIFHIRNFNRIPLLLFFFNVVFYAMQVFFVIEVVILLFFHRRKIQIW